MGLDNGVYCKRDLNESIPFYVKSQINYPDNKKLDLCYWRRWYELRNQIYEALDAPTNKNYWIENKGYLLTNEEIESIIKILVKYLWYPYFKKRQSKNYDWEYRYSVFTNIQHIINLLWILSYKKRYYLEVYFYDSY